MIRDHNFSNEQHNTLSFVRQVTMIKFSSINLSISKYPIHTSRVIFCCTCFRTGFISIVLLFKGHVIQTVRCTYRDRLTTCVMLAWLHSSASYPQLNVSAYAHIQSNAVLPWCIINITNQLYVFHLFFLHDLLKCSNHCDSGRSEMLDWMYEIYLE